MLDLPIGGAAMRPIRLTSLVILALLISGPWIHANGRLLKRARPVLPSVPAAQRADLHLAEAETTVPRIVDGWGETREDAEQMALENARRDVLKYFAEHNQPLEWQPTVEYIKRNLIKDLKVLPAEDLEEPLRRWVGIRLWIEIAPEKWQFILREDRRARSESRMALSGKVLAGFVAFLGAIAGYLRLEEMTKGYYTAWLRLAAIGFVTAVGAGIWWVS
jgi:hypothetical protein